MCKYYTPPQDRLTIGDVDPGPEHFKTRSRMSFILSSSQQADHVMKHD